MRLSMQAFFKLIELPPERLGARVVRVRASCEKRAAIGNGVAVELADPVTLQRAFDRQLLPVGLIIPASPVGILRPLIKASRAAVPAKMNSMLHGPEIPTL